MDQPSVTLLLAAACTAWLAMVTKLVPDNLHPSYQLMGSAVTIQIISGQKQCIYIYLRNLST